MEIPNVPSICAIIVSLVASPIDVRTRKIPNALTLPALAVGIVLNFVLGGMPAGLSAIGGMFAGFLIMVLPGRLSKRTASIGGGDVKLMAALGALLGFRVLLAWGFFSLLYGGFAFIKYLVLFPWKHMKMPGRKSAIEDGSVAKLKQGMGQSLPLAPFIASGTILALVLEHPVLQILGVEH